MVNISIDASHRCLVEAASSAPLILTSTLLELVLPFSHVFREKRKMLFVLSLLLTIIQHPKAFTSLCNSFMCGRHVQSMPSYIAR